MLYYKYSIKFLNATEGEEVIVKCNYLKERIYDIGQKVLEVISSLVAYILLITVIFCISFLLSWHIAVNQVLDKYFVEVQDAGCVTADIKNGIQNEMDDIFGLLFNYEISGTNKKVKGGEEVYLEFKLYPANCKLKNFPITFVRMGRSKRMLNDNRIATIQNNY